MIDVSVQTLREEVAVALEALIKPFMSDYVKSLPALIRAGKRVVIDSEKLVELAMMEVASRRMIAYVVFRDLLSHIVSTDVELIYLGERDDARMRFTTDRTKMLVLKYLCDRLSERMACETVAEEARLYEQKFNNLFSRLCHGEAFPELLTTRRLYDSLALFMDDIRLGHSERGMILAVFRGENTLGLEAKVRCMIADAIEDELTRPDTHRINPTSYALDLPRRLRAGAIVVKDGNTLLLKCAEEVARELKLQTLDIANLGIWVDTKVPVPTQWEGDFGRRLDNEHDRTTILQFISRCIDERIDCEPNQSVQNNMERFRGLHTALLLSSPMEFRSNDHAMVDMITAFCQVLRLTPDQIDRVFAIIRGDELYHLVL